MKPLIVITGASSGIGKVTAMQFSEQGYPLLLMARRGDRLKALDLPNAICAEVDITDREAVQKALDEATAKYGPVDGLVNNAGVMLLGSVQDQHRDEWKRMFDVNVLGLLDATQLVLREMIERNHGTIINISSIAGKKTFNDHAAYVGTKFAVHGLTENIRQEVAKYNVRCITIAPGVVETELLGHTTVDAIKEDYESWKKTIDGGLKAEDVARAVLFAYQQPQYMTIREIVLAPTKQEG